MQPDEIERLLSLGAQAVVHKPFSVVELNDTVKKILAIQMRHPIIR
jgi:DNA-binding NarL/FixJ family response regulator